MRYALAGGGKRVRPVLCLATAEAAGGEPEAALPAAAALELVHNFSLVHDDLPALDDDERAARPAERPGRAYGEAVGDPRRRRAARRGAAARALVPDAGGRPRARAGDARDDRRPVPRHHRRRRRPRRAAPAEDGLPVRGLGRARASGWPRCRSRSRRRGGPSATSSACSSRSWTTSSTGTATCSSTAPRGHARSRTRPPSARRRGARREIDADTSCSKGIVDEPGARQTRPEEAARRPARRARARREPRAGAGARPGRARAGLREGGPAGRRGRPSSTVTEPPRVRLARRREARARARRVRRRRRRARRARRRRVDRRLHRRAAPARRRARDRARRRLRAAPSAHPRRPARDRARAHERARARRSCRSRRELVVCDVSFISVRKRAAAGAGARGAGLGGGRARQAAVRGGPRRGAGAASSATARCTGACCARSPQPRSRWGAQVRGRRRLRACPARRGTASSSCTSSSASGRSIPMSSKTGSTTPLPEIKRVAVVTHGRAETIGEALEQLRARRRRAGVELLLSGRGGAPSTATARAPTSRRPTSPSCSAATARCCARCGASSAPACR